jgi:hypothetical protein
MVALEILPLNTVKRVNQVAVLVGELEVELGMPTFLEAVVAVPLMVQAVPVMFQLQQILAVAVAVQWELIVALPEMPVMAEAALLFCVGMETPKVSF